MKLSGYVYRDPICALATGLCIFTTGVHAYGEHRPVCSPDGDSVVYMAQSERTGEDWELYLMDMDSRKTTRLTDHEGWDGYAVWSADGGRIIFDREDEPDGPKRPWIMDMSTFTSSPLGQFEGQLSISDWRGDDTLLGFHEKDGQRDLVLVNLEGEITRQLTDTPEHSEHDAHYSPDGKRVAYANGALDGGETTLELLELDSGKITVLRTSAGRIYGLDWAPQGDRLAFVDAPGGDEDDADIFIYRFEDQVVQQVTDDPSWDHMPAFCGSRHLLMFTSYRSGEERIYRIDPDPRPWLTIE